jgi:glycosyltransferase involved in cell wall biosynthesis
MLNQAIFSRLKPTMRPDVIHAHGSMFAGVHARNLSHKLGIPYVVTEHACPFSIQTDSYWKRGETRKVLLDASQVIAVSDKLRREMQDFCTVAVYVVPNVVPDLFFRVTDRVSHEGPPRLLFVGQPTIRKGHDLISDLPVRCITEPVSRAAVASWISWADVVLCPSRNESFGMVAAEALCAGRPVLTHPDHPLADLASATVLPTKEAWKKATKDCADLPPPTRPEQFRGSEVVGKLNEIYDRVLCSSQDRLMAEGYG